MRIEYSFCRLCAVCRKASDMKIKNGLHFLLTVDMIKVKARLQTVKMEGGQPGETMEVEELVEMEPDGENNEEDLELELMESQITREEVS